MKKFIIAIVIVLLVGALVMFTLDMILDEALFHFPIKVKRTPVPIENIADLEIGMTLSEVQRICGNEGYRYMPGYTKNEIIEYKIDTGKMTVSEAIDYIYSNCGFDKDTLTILNSDSPEKYTDGMFIMISISPATGISSVFVSYVDSQKAYISIERDRKRDEMKRKVKHFFGIGNY